MTMSYSQEELRDLLERGEDNRCEFKEVDFRGTKPTAAQRDQWADEIVAFSNATGGLLLLGATDDGQVQGISREQLDHVEQMVVEVCRDTISPPVRATVYKERLDGQWIVIVDIPAGDTSYERSGRSYIRVGSAKHLMSSDERLRLTLRRGQAQRQGFDESPVTNSGFGTLSERLWKPLLSAEQHAEPVIGLDKLGLLSEDERGRIRASVAGVLLSTEHPEELLRQAAITATAYQGNDEASSQRDTQTIVGPLNRQVAEGIAFVRRNMKVGAIKDPARFDLPEYSMRAVFEGLVNAVAHRDYTMSGMRIRLRMFSDRLEICSPGSLPNGMTVERMALLQATRNNVIASNMSRMSVAGIEGSEDRRYFMESRGDGVLRIQQETRALTGRMPHFEVIGGIELRLTIPAAVPASETFRGFVHVQSAEQPCVGTEVLALFPNGTYRSAVTDHLGVATFDLYTGHLPMTVYVAARGFRAHLEREWLPAQSPLNVILSPHPDGGSAIIPDRTGSIPPIRGTLNPKLDNRNRTYLYASNIAINDGELQPVTFRPGDEELKLVDADGNGCYVRIVAIEGSSSLLEYRPE